MTSTISKENVELDTAALAKGSVFLVALVVAYALFISWLDPALPWPVNWANRETCWLALLNAVPVLLINVLLIVVTRRVILACSMTVVLLGTLYAINTIKMQELATPLLPDDFHFLRAIGVNYSFFANYLHGARIQVGFAAIVLVVAVLITRERAIPALTGLRRGTAAACTAISIVTLLLGTAPWTSVYHAGRLQFEPWAPFDSASRTGIITNLLLFYWELRDDGSGQYDLAADAERIRDLGPAVQSVPIGEGADSLPDIVIVQSESLFDPARLKGIDGTPLTQLTSLASTSWFGNLTVPTFGGGTIRTEFEVLTGLPLTAFPKVRYPYLQLTRREIPGLVRILGAHGYRTIAIHPNGGAFWNRNVAFQALGFDRFIDADAFADAPKHGWYISDEVLTDRIIAELLDDGPPQMIMAISIQNHGPYTRHGTTEVRSSVSTGHEGLDTYYSLIRATDAQLGRLAEVVAKRARRTLLVFYSDHLPPMNSVFQERGFKDDRPATEQRVPWLIFDNRSRDSRSMELSSWSLASVLLSRAGLTGGRYFDVVERMAMEPLEHVSIPELQSLARLQYWGELEAVLDHARDID